MMAATGLGSGMLAPPGANHRDTEAQRRKPITKAGKKEKKATFEAPPIPFLFSCFPYWLFLCVCVSVVRKLPLIHAIHRTRRPSLHQLPGGTRGQNSTA